MKQAHILLFCAINLVLATVAGRVSAADRLSQANDSDRAGQVTFDSEPLGGFVQGHAPSQRLSLDGQLWFDQHLRVLVWEQSRPKATVAFMQNIAAKARSTGGYVLPRARLNSLAPGNYRLEVQLRQASFAGYKVISQIEQSFTVETAPPTATEPDAPAPVPASEPQILESATDSQEPTLPANNVAATADQTLQSTSTKQVVWNLTPKANTTYSNLILRGGVTAIWRTVDNVTFIDCDFRDAAVLLTVQARDDGSDACHNWQFIRCTFVGATRSDWGHSHGAFVQGADNFTFTNCVFSYNGWLGEQRFNQNHNIYLLDVGDVTFTNCVFHRGAAQGIKGLGYQRLEVVGCVFSGNLIDIGSDDRSASNALIVRNSRFYNVGGYDSIGSMLGWSLALEHYNNNLNSVLIQNCKWFGPAVTSNTWAVKLAGSGVQSATIADCDLTGWHINTAIWPKIVNYIGSRLTITNTVGITDSQILGGVLNSTVLADEQGLLPGDANYDGTVNLADLQILADNWSNQDATWLMGECSGDGRVNLEDLQILADHWNGGAPMDLSTLVIGQP
ncbi:MAG: right-handed parallel beta-helix repeat-containing protein [Phycisphaeraceae bacterium]|nr:right-handed parallel beta-helix repeat-containing protein [Phycisphaeraceae bacterium]